MVAAPVVWIDCVEVGLADRGLARADLVVVPQWSSRVRFVEWAASRARRGDSNRYVLEYRVADVALDRVGLPPTWVRVRWSRGGFDVVPAGGRDVVVSPS